MINFPDSLDSFSTKVDGVDNVMAEHMNDVQAAILALETKVGEDGSTEVSSIDYKLDNLVELKANKGEPGGYAGLNSSSKVPLVNLPSLVITDTFVVASQAAQTSLSAVQGDIAIRTDENKTYILASDDPSQFSNWQQLLFPSSSADSTIFVPYGSIESTDVQGAIEELDDLLGGLSLFQRAAGVISPVTSTDKLHVTAKAYFGAQSEVGKLGGNTVNAISVFEEVRTDFTNPVYGVAMHIGCSPTSDISQIIIGSGSYVSLLTAHTYSGWIIGGIGHANVDVAATITSAEPLSGLVGLVNMEASGSSAEVASGVTGILMTVTGADITNGYGISSSIINAGNIDSASGIFVASINNTGSIENAYGLYISDQSGVGASQNNVNIWSAGANSINYFEGYMTVGHDITVAGQVNCGTFKMTSGAVSGKLLRSDADGLSSWDVLVPSDMPSNIDATKIANGSVSNTVFQYLNGVSSLIQTQLDNKQSKVSGVSDTEIGYLDGVTSSIQSQLNSKQSDLGYVPENVTNKSTDTSLGTSDILYPSQNAVRTYVDNNSASGYKNGITSRAGDAAAGTQNIAHGLGAIPKRIRINVITRISISAERRSHGSYDGTVMSCVYASNSSAGTTSSYIIYMSDGTNIQRATVSVDATNITLTWTTVGSPLAQLMNIMWEAEK